MLGKKKNGFLFTSESVTEGHPDQVCAKISAACLDAILEKDPSAHVAVETAACRDFLLIMGEVTTSAEVDYDKIARDTIRGIGYTNPEEGFDADTVEILVKVVTQSPDIAQGVNQDDEIGAGDQGLVFGGACVDTQNLMPLPISIARALTCRITSLVKGGDKVLRPDGKSQVTVRYGANNEPVSVDTVVISCMHADIDIEEVRNYIKLNVITPVLRVFGFDIKDVKHIYINPTGRFVIGGPAGDSGLNGRKLIVDTYGSYFPHGGGAILGKDPSKVDASACLMARYIAKNIVASGLATKVEIQLSYAIGVVQPVSINIKTFGTSKVPLSAIYRGVKEIFDCTPRGMIETLGLVSGQFKYQDLVNDGVFGNAKYPWEKVDKATELSELVTSYLQ